MTTELWSKNWIIDIVDSGWESRIDESGPARIESIWLRAPERGIGYARGCILTVPGKFFAETLLIYPAEGRDFPIFGSEYIGMGKKFFGAMDFHPPSGDNRPVEMFFPDFPHRKIENSKHYDLNTYFSTKLWHERSETPFYERFEAEARARATSYVSRLPFETGYTPCFRPFDRYMALHDPAHGILRSYFGSEFANDYIKGFLFPHASNYELGSLQANHS